MIIDPNLYSNFKFNEWQLGLLDRLVSLSKRFGSWQDNLMAINMGRASGHTFFAHESAKKEFPIRTKVYLTSSIQMAGFADLLFHPEKCHEIVDVIHSSGFTGYHGSPVDLFVIDLASQPVDMYYNSLERLGSSSSSPTILLLQPGV